MPCLVRSRNSKFRKSTDSLRTIFESKRRKSRSVIHNKFFHKADFLKEQGTAELPSRSRQENFQVPADFRHVK